MQNFESDGIKIAYVDEGRGDPILLIHGFASNVATNWLDSHWLSTLTNAGRRAVAYDNRGHGRSEKIYDPSHYGAPTMAEDALKSFEVELGLVTPETTPVAPLAKDLGPATEQT